MRKYQTATGKNQSVNVAPIVVPNFISVSTTLHMDIAVYPYDESTAASRVKTILDDAADAKPLRRSKNVNDLADKACKLRGRRPTSRKSWASKLAGSLTRPND